MMSNDARPDRHSTPEFRIVGVPAFRDNYIWVLEAGGRAIVVDPGDAAPVFAHLAQHRLALAAVWLTHHHADHVGGVAELLRQHPETPVRGPAAESITGVGEGLRGGETFAALGHRWRVLAVPGHTRGHIAYYTPGTLFCGDVLFGLGCGRLFEGTPAVMYASLQTLAALPDDTAIYCAHEYAELNLPFALRVEPGNAVLGERAAEIRRRREAGRPTVPMSLREERASNPFLRVAVPEVAAAARGFDPSVQEDDPVAVFAALREWRNRF